MWLMDLFLMGMIIFFLQTDADRDPYINEVIVIFRSTQLLPPLELPYLHTEIEVFNGPKFTNLPRATANQLFTIR